MINIEDLTAGKTVLVTGKGVDLRVVEVFSQSILCEAKSGSLVIYTLTQVNNLGFIIKQSKRPQVGNYYEMLPKVRCRDYDTETWKEGRLISFTDSEVNFPFQVLNLDGTAEQYRVCELLEEE